MRGMCSPLSSNRAYAPYRLNKAQYRKGETMKMFWNFIGYVLALYITVALAVSIAVASIVVLALYPFFLLYEQARKAIQA